MHSEQEMSSTQAFTKSNAIGQDEQQNYQNAKSVTLIDYTNK